MKARLWMATGAAVLIVSSASTAHAQDAMQTIMGNMTKNTMMVVIKYNEGKDPSQYAPPMAAATGMQLVGVSPSTNTAVFNVPNETDRAHGTVAARNQQTVTDGFPGVIMSYNYGVNYPAPRDLQAPRPVQPAVVVVERERGRPGPGRFADRDRMAFRSWYANRRDLWLRLREGDVLDGNIRMVALPAPIELTRQMGPIRFGERYFIIGENLVLVDRQYYVLDIIRFGDRDYRDRDDRDRRGGR